MRARKQKIVFSVIVLSVLFAFMASSAAWAKGIKVLDNHYKVVRLAEDTLFPGANGATIGADGNLYVVHTGNSSITRIDLKTMKAAPFVKPYEAIFITDDIAADPNGIF